MRALNIRDIGDDRKAALEAEAKRQGVSVSELVRRFLDDGIGAARAARARQEWLAEAHAGLAYEAEELDRAGPSLARYRRIQSTVGSGDGDG
jgi:post-segregation antitoxin (ccd killing protein)